MTRYFYDPEVRSIVAFDDEVNSVRVLREISGEQPPSPADEHEPPKRKYVKRDSSDVETPPARKGKGKGCDECGSPSRHKKTCSKAGGASPSKHQGKSGRSFMSQMAFGRVKISQSHDVPSATISRNLDIPVDEVEKAFVVETYSDYQNF